MPGLVHKLIIIAAADGILLQPSPLRNQRPGAAVQINYRTNSIISLADTQADNSKSAQTLEAHGIVGLFTVASSSYLISISGRQQVAQIRGKPVYVITGVDLIPLSSQSDAQKAIELNNANSKKAASRVSAELTSDSDTSEDENEDAKPDQVSNNEDDDPTIPHTPEADKSEASASQGTVEKTSSVVQDVIGRKGQYGRFAEKWFSKRGWSVEKRRMQGMSEANSEGSGYKSRKASGIKSTVASEDSPDVPTIASDKQDQRQEIKEAPTDPSIVADNLTPKLLKTTKMLLSSRSFYFSYDYDITRRLGTVQTKNSDVPLHKSVDSLYFWNRHLASSFIDAGQHSFVLPLMQGFVGQRAFTVNTESEDPSRSMVAATENVGEIIQLQNNASSARDFRASPETRDFLITLVSRRSTLRPGLRYLRRGIDSEGDTANYVETEQILSVPSWSPSGRIHSFTQVRGSIPLYFTQSPYSFKPVPFLQHSYEANRAAFRRHFTNLINTYSNVQVVLLVDKQGVEAKIGEEYEKHTIELNNENGINGVKLGFEWFDFHNICRGMKFENVSILIDSIGSIISEFGTTVEKDGKIQRGQSGALRTNCMDCLDRTNVVQSACGQRSLEEQLNSEGITLRLQADNSTQWFNTLWADNGDAISKQYSSTAALKGDYTRTRKRDYRGAINDFGLTLSRYFNNIVNDYFSQAVIDFLLGKVTDRVFSDFEADMMSGDPAMSMRKVRQSAIDTSSKIVIADQDEDFLGGWTLLCPKDPNTLRTFPFEEIVLLLTNTAIYAVRFDWNIEKVAGFERVELKSIVGIMKGIYITSTLAAAQTDEERNVGFVVRYRPGQKDVARINTRSLSTAVAPRKGEFDEARRNREGGGRAEAERESAGDPHGPDDEAVGDLQKRMTNACDLEGSSASTDLPNDSNVKANLKDVDKSTEFKSLAFKALPADSSFASMNRDGSERQDLSEKKMVETICEEIAKAIGGDALAGRRVVTREGLVRETSGIVEEGNIISLAEARKSTGLFEQLGHSLKKLVWA
ncbi:hypothetical protein MMC26_004151 [Xylographa opegraphella]|nr:hypothetical protein [Xylographa opegraphella]